MRVHALAPVVAIDLDGSLGRYHDHFVWFLETIYFPGYRIGPLLWETQKGEFSKALGMDKAIYRDAKLAYRQGGLKRCMPTFADDHIPLSFRTIRELGVQIWITTNRPWMRLDNIDKDTKFWIDQNCGEVDGVIFSQEKYDDLIDNVGKDRILGVLDDLPENIIAARERNLNTAIRTGDHNHWWETSVLCPPDVRRIYNLSTFVHIVRQWKEEWDAQHPGVL